MEVSQFKLAIFCISAVIEGIFVGVTYDIFSVVLFNENKPLNVKLINAIYKIEFPLIGCVWDRGKKPERYWKKLFLFLYDLIFMISVGILVSVLIYRFNDGQIRFGVLLLLPVGYFIYRKLLRTAVLILLELILFIVKCILSYFLYFTVKPLKHLLISAGRSVKGKIDKSIEKHSENRLKKHSEFEKAKILRNALACGGMADCYKKGELNDKLKNNQQSNNLDNDSVACRDGDRCNRQFDAT